MRTCERRRRGLSLAVTLLVLLILSVLGLALGALGISNLDQIEESTRRALLVQAANGGLHELMDRLYANPTSAEPGSGTYTTSLGPAWFWWSFDRTAAGYSVNNLTTADATRSGWQGRSVPPLSALVVVSADLVPPARSREPVRVAAVCTKNFRMAVSADGTVAARDIRGSGGHPGNLWSNASGSGVLVSASSADGQVFSNGPQGAIAIAGNPPGIPYCEAGRLRIPDIPIPSVVASYDPRAPDPTFGGPATHYSPGTLTLTTDSLGRIEVKGGTLLAADGTPVTSLQPPGPNDPDLSLYVEGDLEFSGGATLAPRIHYFVRGDLTVLGSLGQLPSAQVGGVMDNFLFVGGLMQYRGAQASNINMFAEEGIEQLGSSNYKGVFYVRDGDVRVAGGGTASDFEGVMIVGGSSPGAGDLDAASANFTYNPAYLEAMERFHVSVKEDSPVFTLSWWLEDR